MDTSVATVSAERVAEGRDRILKELRKVIVGQDEIVEQVLIALFTGGHCLITGVPGLAKTLLVSTALLFWIPVCGPFPELRISPPAQMIYLFVASIVPTVPGEIRNVGPLVVAGDSARLAYQSLSGPALALERFFRGPYRPRSCRGDAQTSSPASTPCTFTMNEKVISSPAASSENVFVENLAGDDQSHTGTEPSRLEDRGVVGDRPVELGLAIEAKGDPLRRVTVERRDVELVRLGREGRLVERLFE